MAMQYDGKTYRNLQEQVAYLTAKWQELANEIDELRAQIPSKMIVEELPEEGDPLITYYVGPKGTAPNQYYEVWIWVQEEEDGPFVWRELEDTDQVDLSGYLPIQDGVTTLPQVYGKTEAGVQAMINMDIAATALTIPFRDANGRTKVAAPSADGDAANKKYCDDGFVAKLTGTTSYDQVYVKYGNGTQGMMNASNAARANMLAIRDSNSQLDLPDQSQYAPSTDQSISKRYADTAYLAKQTGTSSYIQAYVKGGDGLQGMIDVADYTVLASSIVRRTGAGQVRVPTTPTNGADAASKDYVDAAVGQLLYLHDIEIIVTVDSTNKLYIKAYLINGSSTAVSSIDSSTFKRMDVQYGCFGVDVENGTPCAVTKKPDGFAYGDFDGPRPSYLYQYISGGSLVSGVTDNSMTVTFTDTVITF